MFDPRSRRRLVAAAAAIALSVQPLTLYVGALNAEVNNMFNSLGAIGNYTAPGAFKGQTFGTYAGGNFFMRSPNKVYQLAAIQFPSAKAGCGGIDVFGGSCSHISAQEFKNMLRNITAGGRTCLFMPRFSPNRPECRRIQPGQQPESPRKRERLRIDAHNKRSDPLLFMI